MLSYFNLSVVKDLDEEKNPIKKATIISVIGENSPLKNGVLIIFNILIISLC